MSEETTVTEAPTPERRHNPGRPNGKTERRRKLKAMSADERKAHRKTWKAKQRSEQKARKDRVRAKKK